VGQGDLPGGDWIAVGDVRLRVVEAVFQFDVHSHPELLYVEASVRPVDPDLFSNLPCLIGAEARSFGHLAPCCGESAVL
jgi:hypothetical protein